MVSLRYLERQARSKTQDVDPIHWRQALGPQVGRIRLMNLVLPLHPPGVARPPERRLQL